MSDPGSPSYDDLPPDLQARLARAAIVEVELLRAQLTLQDERLRALAAALARSERERRRLERRLLQLTGQG